MQKEQEEKNNFKENTNFEETSFTQKSYVNFRETKIIPTITQLKETRKPDLLPIKAKGHYQDLDEYLDTNFRLLKEDYSQDFRKGVYDYVVQVNKSQD